MVHLPYFKEENPAPMTGAGSSLTKGLAGFFSLMDRSGRPPVHVGQPVPAGTGTASHHLNY
jgi:hypothetical protein